MKINFIYVSEGIFYGAMSIRQYELACITVKFACGIRISDLRTIVVIPVNYKIDITCFMARIHILCYMDLFFCFGNTHRTVYLLSLYTGVIKSIM